MFGALCSEEQLKTMMKDADTNGDNKISFLEFKEMMLGFNSVTSAQLKNSWSMP